MSQLMKPTEDFCTDPEAKYGTGAGYGKWLVDDTPVKQPSLGMWITAMLLATAICVVAMHLDNVAGL